MKTLNIYLHFSGECRQALNFYKKAIGGEIKSIQTYGEANMAKDDSQKDMIMHSEFQAEGLYFMAADGLDGYIPVFGNNISLSINLHNEKEQTRIFDEFANGGLVLMPLEDTFWGARFGMVRDKFGVQWMLNCEKSE